MKSKFLGMGTFVFAGLFVFACAQSAPVVEDDDDLTGAPAEDASTADATKPTPKDASTTQKDASTTVDSSTDSSVTQDATPPPPPPPTDSGTTTIPQCTGGLDLAKGLIQLNNNDTPPCDATCNGCCYPFPAFCVKKI